MKKIISVMIVLFFSVFASHLFAESMFQITGDNGYLVGGGGDTGDSFRYDGSEIWKGPGEASIVVDDQKNTGVVKGSVTTHGHTYTITLDRFMGMKPFMDGGIARDIYIHGTTGKGPPVLPKVWSYLAGWGTANILKDGKVLYKDYEAHFMLTHGTRDKKTHKVKYPGPKRLMMAKKSGDKAEIEAAKKEIDQAAAKAIDTRTMQLHIVAHSDKKNPKNFPPFEEFIHFMWDDITWH